MYINIFICMLMISTSLYMVPYTYIYIYIYEYGHLPESTVDRLSQLVKCGQMAPAAVAAGSHRCAPEPAAPIGDVSKTDFNGRLLTSPKPWELWS